MQVLTLTPFYPKACDDAAGCFIVEPIRALDELGIKSCVVAVEPLYRARSTPNGHPAQWVRYAAIPGGMGLASSGTFLYAGLLSRIRRWHRQRPIEVIHAHAALPCGHAAAILSRKLHIPFVVTVHGLDVFFATQMRDLAARWCKRVAQSVYRSATRVVCISGKVANELINGGIHADNLQVIHNGVDSIRFSPGPSEPDGPIILSVGNLIPTKGQALLLRGFAILQERFPNISCEIIGDGPERSHLTELAERLHIVEKVRFLGRQSRKQVAEAMQRCAVFALPSHYEGLGCVYLEAMSAGKPVVGCRGQGIEDIVQHGQNGWLIDPNNLSEMTNALSVLVDDAGLRGRIGTAARESILARHTLAHQAARLAQLYRECVA